MNTRGGRKTPTSAQQNGSGPAPASKRRVRSGQAGATTSSSSSSKTRSTATRRNGGGGLKNIAEESRANGHTGSGTDSSESSDSSSAESTPNHSTASSSPASASSASPPEAAAAAAAAATNSAATSPEAGAATTAAAPAKPPPANSSSSSSSNSRKPAAAKAASRKRRQPASGSGGAAANGLGSEAPTKRARNNSQTTASPPTAEDLRIEVQLFATVRSVLATQYFDVVQRLQLDFQPGCLSNLEYCAQNHSRNGDPPNEIDDYLVRDARNFIAEDRPHVFLKFVSKLSVSNEFPGTSLVLSLLELILTVNRPSHSHYTAPFIVESANLLFENITNNFPPCWLDVRDSYKKLLVERLHMDLPKNKYDTNGGILKMLLSMLETVLQEECDLDHSLDDGNNSAEFDEFYAWEQKNKQRYLFEMLPRDDKLDRIFQVLHLLVKMMEGDLAIWIIRHPKNTSSTMSKPKKMPLIGYFLWPAEECGQINALVKRILNLFVICISIGIAEDKIKILARFVNLVSHAINLCELQPKTTDIKYPNIQSHTEIFALEVKKTIEKIQTCNVDLFLAVIDHLRAPFIQIIAIDQLLMKFNRDIGKPSMKKLFQNFTKRRWRECDEEGSRKLFTHVPDIENMSRYPVYRPLTHKKRTSDIYQTDYLHLLLSSYRSYQLLYQVDVITRLGELQLLAETAAANKKAAATAGGSKDGEETVAPQASNAADPAAAASGAAAAADVADEEDAPQSGMTAAEYEEHTRIVNRQRQDKFNFVEMEKGIGRLEQLAEQSASLDVAYYPRLDCSAHDIIVDSTTVIRYRDDIKHYCMLRELIEEFGDDYGEIFAPWLSAVRHKPRLPVTLAQIEEMIKKVMEARRLAGLDVGVAVSGAGGDRPTSETAD